jgi:tetratricopeptide (TPR) repeat protein
MNTRHCFLTWLAVFFVLSSYGHCLAEDQATTLTVKEIVLKIHKNGEEKVAVLCSQACVPALSVVEGNKLRIIMDFAGVSYIEPKYRNVPVSSKYVKIIRSYLDHASRKLRVVLDMDPSKHYVVHPTQDQTANAYSLVISEKRGVKGKYSTGPPGTKANRISIIDQERRPIDKDFKPAETAIKHAPVSVDSTTEDKISVERGRSRMNAGNYAGAFTMFTEMIAKNPKDSLAYRLRGNAFQNMGLRQKAIGDWTTAARLGNEIAQSYLDDMQINWKEVPKP